MIPNYFHIDRYYRGAVKVVEDEQGVPKKPAHSFLFDKPLYDFDKISHMPHVGGALKQDIVMIDVDDPDMGKRFISLLCASGVKCQIIKTTKGVHALFKDDPKRYPTNTNKQKLACGIIADIKSGARPSFEVLKQNGVWREVVQECADPQMPPKWLTPVNTEFEFHTMGEGGRNNALYGYISTLGSKKHRFTEDEAFECIRLMNDFIMQNPLSEDELNVILRPGAMPSRDYSGGSGRGRGGNRTQFEHWKVGDELIEEYQIKRINGSIHIYDDGIYKPARNGWLDSILIKYDPTLTAAKRTEVARYIEGSIMKNTAPTDARYIAFRNGLYDIVEGQLIAFTPDMVITNRIEYDYVEGSYSEIADKTLNKLACNDEAVRALLEEIIGYCFYRRSELRKSFVLIGDKANGKSTYLDMIKTLLGDENTSALDIQELGDRFKTAELCGKLANIGDDIGDMYIPNPSVFKKLVSGDRLNAEYKGQNPFDFSNYAKMLFSANAIPRIKDKSGAVLDRLIIVPFDATFSKTDPDYDPYIKYRLRDRQVMEYLIVLGLQGLKRVLEAHGFTSCKRVEKELEAYNKENNPVLSFLEDIDVEKDIYNQDTGTVFKAYQIYCAENNYQSLGRSVFTKVIKRQYPKLETVRVSLNGKQVWVYKKIDTSHENVN